MTDSERLEAVRQLWVAMNTEAYRGDTRRRAFYVEQLDGLLVGDRRVEYRSTAAHSSAVIDALSALFVPAELVAAIQELTKVLWGDPNMPAPPDGRGQWDEDDLIDAVFRVAFAAGVRIPPWVKTE